MRMAAKEKDFYERLGRRIAERRKALDITQVQLAKTLGVAQQTMAHYEGGVSRIAVALLPPLARPWTPRWPSCSASTQAVTASADPHRDCNASSISSASYPRPSRSSSARCSTPCCSRPATERLNKNDPRGSHRPPAQDVPASVQGVFVFLKQGTTGVAATVERRQQSAHQGPLRFAKGIRKPCPAHP